MAPLNIKTESSLEHELQGREDDCGVNACMIEVTESLIKGGGVVLWSALLPMPQQQEVTENMYNGDKSSSSAIDPGALPELHTPLTPPTPQVVDEPKIVWGSIEKLKSYSEQELQELVSMSLGERIQQGKSVVTIANVLTRKEVSELKESCLEAAKQKVETNKSSDNEHIQNRLVIRMPTRSACERHNCMKDALPEPISNQLEGEIFPRILQIVDRQLSSSLRNTLFAAVKNFDNYNEVYSRTKTAPSTTSSDKDQGQKNDIDISLLHLYQTKQLYFSTREPAVNVYHAPHAFIGMHTDSEHLTILISLSDPETDFEGGGTAFWKELYPQEGRHNPSFVLKPKQPGTAILFGGTVKHSGLHTTSGERVMFVSSFSRNKPPAPESLAEKAKQENFKDN